MDAPTQIDQNDLANRARSRIARRLLPFLLLLFVLAFLDRTNISVASLAMKTDLGFTEAIIGTGAGVFFLGYFLLEIPGTLMVERWSARKWIARIMVSWGIVAALMGVIGFPILSFLHVQTQFYGLRFILGLAEAGFFPGVIIYLTRWFRYEDRAKAKSLFLIGVPLATVIATPLSQFLMRNVAWLGYAGWRWVFFLEGIPSILLGIVTWFYLTDHPREAKWLPEDEKAWLVDELEREKQVKVALGGDTIVAALKNPQMWLLSTIYLLGVTGMYGFTFFLPSIVDRMKDASLLAQVTISTLPFVFGAGSMMWNAAHSDRTLERRWHTALPLLCAAGSMAVVDAFSNNTWIAALGMCLFGMSLFAYLPVFWTHPNTRLTASSAAFAVGLINSIGNLGGYVGPKIVGQFKTDSGNYASGLWFLTICLLLAGVLAMLLTASRTTERTVQSVR